MRARTWLSLTAGLAAALLLAAALTVFAADPLLHFHAPLPFLYYDLKSFDAHYMNDGVGRRLPFDAVLCGTSLLYGISPDKPDDKWGLRFVRFIHPGGTYREVGANLARCLDRNPSVRLVLWGLDQVHLEDEPDALAYPADQYPFYLYDDCAMNDAPYLLGAEYAIKSARMLYRALRGAPGGVSPLRNFGRYYDPKAYGRANALRRAGRYTPPEAQIPLPEEKRSRILRNLAANVEPVLLAHPDVTFYLFIPPYSAVNWGQRMRSGQVSQTVEGERTAALRLLRHPNVRLYDFSMLTEYTTNPDHYRDSKHFDRETADHMLALLGGEAYRVTPENLDEFFRAEEEFYLNYDYAALFAG